MVSLVLSSAVFNRTGNFSIYALPVGFRPTRAASARGIPVFYQVGGDAYGAVAAVNVYDSGGLWLDSRTSTNRHLGTCLWTTHDDWPIVLPGSAL